MQILKLNIPRQMTNRHLLVKLNAVSVNKWIEHLPLANQKETTGMIISVLRQFNQMKMPERQRDQIMMLFPKVVTPLLEPSRQPYLLESWPFPTKSKQHYESAQQLLQELAIGHKIIINNLLMQSSSEKTETEIELMPRSIFQAVYYLSQQLLHSYIIYAPEIPGVWYEINQLYLFAEKNGFHTAALSINDKQLATSDLIDHIYKHMLMLALIEPYHLMQGDAPAVYEQLKQWVYHCKILNMGENELTGGRFFIDLAIDMPPRYQSLNKNAVQPIEGRIIDISELSDVIHKQFNRIEHNNEDVRKHQNTLETRKLRATYQRLAHSISARPERLSARTTRLSPVVMAVGLSACHHYINNELEFTPEHDEIEIRKQSKQQKKSMSELLDSENLDPWKEEDEELRLQSGILKPRNSSFGSKEEKQRDVWAKIYATSTQHIDEKNKSSDHHYRTIVTRQINTSQGGLALLYSDTQSRISVGELITFKEGKETINKDLRIGTVRWMKSNDGNGLELGISILSDDALAIATKALKGVGAGGEYFRSFLTPRMNPMEYPTTLITSSGIYDVDTILVVNLKHHLLYAQLTQLVETTNSFSNFRFKLVSPPQDTKAPKEAELYKIDKIFR